VRTSIPLWFPGGDSPPVVSAPRRLAQHLVNASGATASETLLPGFPSLYGSHPCACPGDTAPPSRVAHTARFPPFEEFDAPAARCRGVRPVCWVPCLVTFTLQLRAGLVLVQAPRQRAHTTKSCPAFTQPPPFQDWCGPNTSDMTPTHAALKPCILTTRAM
jgi:hypothetical protein